MEPAGDVEEKQITALALKTRSSGALAPCVCVVRNLMADGNAYRGGLGWFWPQIVLSV